MADQIRRVVRTATTRRNELISLRAGSRLCDNSPFCFGKQAAPPAPATLEKGSLRNRPPSPQRTAQSPPDISHAGAQSVSLPGGGALAESPCHAVCHVACGSPSTSRSERRHGPAACPPDERFSDDRAGIE